MDKKELDERFIKGAWTAMRRAAFKVVSEALTTACGGGNAPGIK